MDYGIICSLCRKKLADGEAAYGMTSGCIDDDVVGFRMDINDEWVVYCPDCMNTLDKLIAGYKHEVNK